MKPRLGPYKIGLAVLGVFTLVLVGLVLAQASAKKQDSATYDKATKIAEKLSNYTATRGKIPATLAEVGVDDAPSTITYTRLSSSQYKFCVKYKAASADFNATSAVTDAVYGKYSSFGSSSYNFSSSSYLYVPSSHKKGDNCQTIKPSLYGGYNSSSSSNYYSNYFNSSSNASTTSNDTQRQTDITSLYYYLETAYALNGKYPTLEELNDTAWQTKNMYGLDKETYRDPEGTSYKLVAAPAAKNYSYTVTGDNGKTCDNAAVSCTTYSLSATLGSGTLYTKKSLN